MLNGSHVHKQLPQHTEHQALRAVGNDPCLQTPTQQAAYPIRRHHSTGGIQVPNTSFIYLSVRLDNTQ